MPSLALSPLNRQFQVQPTQNQVPVTKPKFKSVSRKSDSSRKTLAPPHSPPSPARQGWAGLSPAEPPSPRPTPAAAQPSPGPSQPQPHPAPARLPQLSPAQFAKIRFQSENLVKTFGQYVSVTAFGQNLLAPKPLTIAINPKPWAFFLKPPAPSEMTLRRLAESKSQFELKEGRISKGSFRV